MPIASRDSAHLLDRYFLLARKAVSDLPPLALLAVKFSIYEAPHAQARSLAGQEARAEPRRARRDRKSTRLNSSHGYISYAVFCLKKKKTFLKNLTAVVQRLIEPCRTLHDVLIR